MNIKLVGSLLIISLIACPLLYIFVGPALDATQLETLKILGIICGGSFRKLTIGGGIGIINWTIIGALLLIVLFQGSSAFAEEISGAKYPEYADYCRQVPKFLPIPRKRK